MFNLTDIRADFGVHLIPEGLSTVREYVEVARSRGIKKLAITGKIKPFTSDTGVQVVPWNQMEVKQIDGAVTLIESNVASGEKYDGILINLMVAEGDSAWRQFCSSIIYTLKEIKVPLGIQGTFTTDLECSRLGYLAKSTYDSKVPMYITSGANYCEEIARFGEVCEVLEELGIAKVGLLNCGDFLKEEQV